MNTIKSHKITSLTSALVQLFIIVFFGAIGALAPGFCFYQLWDWSMDQIPATNEWAGLIKVGITCGMIFFGGGITIGLTILLGVIGLAIGTVAAELFD